MKLKLLVALILYSTSLFAQSTPTLGLNLPPDGTLNWGFLIRQNFSTLDSALSGATTLPSLHTTNFIVDSTITINGTPVTNFTGTGSVVLATSPTITNPTFPAADTNSALTIKSTTASSTNSPNLVFQDNQGSPQVMTVQKAGNSLTVSNNTGATVVTFAGTGQSTFPNGLAIPAGGLSIGGGTNLTTTNRTGTGNLVLSTNATLTTPGIVSPNINVGIANNGSGVQHKRLVTAAVAAATRTSAVVTWNTAFPDTNYTAICEVLDTNYGSTATGFIIERLAAQTTTSVTVTFINQGASGPFTVTLECIAFHD